MSGRGTWRLRVSWQTPESVLSPEDYILALLSEEDFYAFETAGDVLEAFTFSERAAQEGKKLLEDALGRRCQAEVYFIPERNWNEIWEQSYQPAVLHEGALYVRAPHHPPASDGVLEIIIKPAMGFGTGHHPTTALMAEALMQEHLEGTTVLDVGCGSGILAILAARRGAKHVMAVDNDPAALENARENILLNGITSETIALSSDIRTVSGVYDIIMANINRNILRDLSGEITRLSRPGSQLFLSGFFREDEDFLVRHYGPMGWVKRFFRTQDGWSLLALKREIVEGF